MQIQHKLVISSQPFREGREVGFIQGGSSGDGEADFSKIYLMKTLQLKQEPKLPDLY